MDLAISEQTTAYEVPTTKPKGRPRIPRPKFVWETGATPQECFQLMVDQVKTYLLDPKLNLSERLKIYRVIAAWKVGVQEEVNKDLQELKDLFKDVKDAA